MIKKIFILLVLAASIAFAKVNVGFYSLTQTGGDLQNKWIGYALADILSEKLAAVREINVVTDDQIYDFLVSKGMNPSVNTRSINSFSEDIKTNFNLDFVVTGNYSVNQDNSLPVNIIVYDLQENFTNSPIVIQGYANDLYTMVSYITQPICNNMRLNLAMDELSKIKQIDLTVKRTGMANIYKGKINLRAKDYKGASDFFEEAFKEDPTNSAAKKLYDEALSHFYGNGIFSYNLLETDYENSTPFRKQYMITRKISKSYKGDIIGTSLSPRNVGSHFDIKLDVKLTLPEDVYSITSDLISKFASGGQSAVQGGVYNPNATKVLTEREIFEKNVENFMLTVKFIDKDGKTIQQAEQSFKTSFGMTYSGAVKDKVFHKRSIETFVSMVSVPREIVKNTVEVKISVE